MMTPSDTAPPRPAPAPDGARSRRFRAMGTDCHLVVIAPSNADTGEPLLDAAAIAIDDLERRWSRFRPDSEVSALSGFAGSWVEVSGPTVQLVDRAVTAWRLTDGRFDPTVDVSTLGYARPFDDLARTVTTTGTEPRRPARAAGLCGEIEIDHDHLRVRLPAGTAFDPGGIGKGLAADRVTDALLRRGARGVLVNLGGDLRVEGVGPDGGPWSVAVGESTLHPDALTTITLDGGAIATSTSLRRRWLDAQAIERHHVVDPLTGAPTTERPGDVVVATAVAADGWWAEAAATASIGTTELPPLPHVHLRCTTADGTIRRSAGFPGETTQ